MSDIQYGHESNRPMHIVAATKYKKTEKEMYLLVKDSTTAKQSVLLVFFITCREKGGSFR